MFPKSDLQHLGVQHTGGQTDYFFSSPKTSRKCLVHLSGVHGVEGHIGSLIQHELLKMKLAELSFQVVIVHIVNPFGYRNHERTNIHNVDLNRNVLVDYHLDNPDFAKLRPFLKSGKPRHLAPVAALLLQKGFQHIIRSTACGQTDFQDSLFFAGKELQPELVSLKETLLQIIPSDSQVTGLDVHTGLGSFAQELLILDGFGSDKERAFFETTFKAPTIWPGRTPRSFRADGPVSLLLKRQWPSFHIFQEFGTQPFLKVLKALMSSNPQERLETFFPSDEKWRELCVQKGLLRFQQLAQALSSTE